MKAVKRVSLALQGGGTHGAFTWGVLDRILESGSLEIDAVAGTSAGAVNAALLVDGLSSGGPAAARRLLSRFWERVIEIGPFVPSLSASRRLAENVPAVRDLHDLAEDLADAFRPPASWPGLPLFDVNPLAPLLADLLDFDRLQTQTAHRLFVNATDVETAECRVFDDTTLTLDSILASACLPTVMPPVAIDGRLYWDGGFSANPPLHTLVYGAQTADILLVTIMPRYHGGRLRTRRDVVGRMTQLSFMAALESELRYLRLLTHLHAAGEVTEDAWEPLHLHRIDFQENRMQLAAGSMMEVDRRRMRAMHAAGRDAADAFLARHRSAIGERSTVGWQRTPPRRRRSRAAADPPDAERPADAVSPRPRGQGDPAPSGTMIRRRRLCG